MEVEMFKKKPIMILVITLFCLTFSKQNIGAETIDLPQSGQVTSRSPLDDGFIQAGQKLPAIRFQKIGGTIRDTLTDLRWIADGLCVTGISGITYGNINTKIGIFNSDPSSCGLQSSDTGWRLPTVVELMSLMNAEPDSNPKDCSVWLMEPSQGFTNITNSYWTSTYDSQDSNFVWFIETYGGAPYRINPSIFPLPKFYLLLVNDNLL